MEPVLTTAAACGTAVESSLGSAGLPQWSQTQAYASNIYLLSPVSSSSSRQMQGVMGAALNRHKLRVRCAASALRSSAEAASSVLSTSPESWIARVGRGNSSTRHKGVFCTFLDVDSQWKLVNPKYIFVGQDLRDAVELRTSPGATSEPEVHFIFNFALISNANPGDWRKKWCGFCLAILWRSCVV